VPVFEIVLNFLWTIIIGASLVACIAAATIVYVTRKID
jgi:hypothetical protein